MARTKTEPRTVYLVCKEPEVKCGVRLTRTVLNPALDAGDDVDEAWARQDGRCFACNHERERTLLRAVTVAPPAAAGKTR